MKVCSPNLMLLMQIVASESSGFRQNSQMDDSVKKRFMPGSEKIPNSAMAISLMIMFSEMYKCLSPLNIMFRSTQWAMCAKVF